MNMKITSSKYFFQLQPSRSGVRCNQVTRPRQRTGHYWHLSCRIHFWSSMQGKQQNTLSIPFEKLLISAIAIFCFLFPLNLTIIDQYIPIKILDKPPWENVFSFLVFLISFINILMIKSDNPRLLLSTWL